MVYIMLSRQIDDMQEKIIEFVKKTLRINNINYHLKFFNKHINDDEISEINENNFLLWHPKVAGDNLSIVIDYKNSIVLLENKTVLTRKVSEKNPINENLAINYGFFIMYINEFDTEITNKEWKIVVQENLYLVVFDTLIKLLKKDLSNWKNNKIPEVIENKLLEEQMLKKISQINL